MDVGKNRCGHSGPRTLNLAVSRKEIDKINWVFVCCYKFRKVKIYFDNFCLGVVKNVRGHIDHRTVKLVVS